MEEGIPGRLVVGRYRLIAEIGSGGMGRVWEARDEQLNRPVALKEVQIHVASAREREDRLIRAEREGRNAAALADHPNVVTVYDVVIEDGVPWTVMQLVRGRSLRDVLESGPLPAGQVADIAAAMLSALGAAHTAGIVHRDVKPGNIMLADDGRVLLTDFGIAKGGGDETVTSTGGFLGSLEYTAPERAEGAVGGPPSDLFSLGVTLYHAVEGEPPFHRESRTGILTAILLRPLPAMRHAAGPLQLLIRALTMKDPATRPTVAQARDLLSGARDDWEPLAAAATLDGTVPAAGAAAAGTATATPGPAGPKPPWEDRYQITTGGPGTPHLAQSPTLHGPPRERRSRRGAVIAGLAVGTAAALVGAFVLLNSGSDGGSGSGGIRGGQALAGATDSTSGAINGGEVPLGTLDPGGTTSSANPPTGTGAGTATSGSATGPTSAGATAGQPGTPPPASSASPGPKPTTTRTTAPPPQTQWAEQVGASGAPLFLHTNASGAGPKLPSHTWVQVSCKVKGSTSVTSAYPDGYWYRIASGPGVPAANQYYSPANNFKNGDPWVTPIPNPHNTDFNVPNC